MDAPQVDGIDMDMAYMARHIEELEDEVVRMRATLQAILDADNVGFTARAQFEWAKNRALIALAERK